MIRYCYPKSSFHRCSNQQLQPTLLKSQMPCTSQSQVSALNSINLCWNRFHDLNFYQPRSIGFWFLIQNLKWFDFRINFPISSGLIADWNHVPCARTGYGTFDVTVKNLAGGDIVSGINCLKSMHWSQGHWCVLQLKVCIFFTTKGLQLSQGHWSHGHFYSPNHFEKRSRFHHPDSSEGQKLHPAPARSMHSSMKYHEINLKNIHICQNTTCSSRAETYYLIIYRWTILFQVLFCETARNKRRLDETKGLQRLNGQNNHGARSRVRDRERQTWQYLHHLFGKTRWCSVPSGNKDKQPY